MNSQKLLAPLETSAGVDYLTQLVPRMQEVGFLLEKMCRDRVGEELRRGAIPNRWEWRSYKGLQFPGWLYGVNEQSIYTRMWGEELFNTWRDTIVDTESVKRVDLAVDVLFKKPDWRYLRTLFRAYERGEWQQRYNARVAAHLSQAGDTLYLGNRRKPLYLRVYDKGLQSKSKDRVAGELWRYEVEVKYDRAPYLAEALIASDPDGSYIKDYVHRVFSERGLEPVFDPAGTDTQLQSKVRVSTDSGLIEWLGRTVSPVVAKLAQKGLFNEVEEALRLKDMYKWEVGE